MAQLGLFALPALVLSMPNGLLPFGLCLLLSSVLGLPLLRQGAGAMGAPLRALVWLTVALVAFALLSNALFEDELRDVDSRSRFIVLPWAALWAYSLGPGTRWLWRGALVGLFVALAIALVQVVGGAPRADGWTNAIVFADLVLVMMVVATCCRPSGRWSEPLVLLALLAGCGTIVLSGSRGVWPGVLVLLAFGLWGLRCWRSTRTRTMVLAAALVLGGTLLSLVPGLERQMRLTELQMDMQRLERGDVESSSGARLERLSVAYATFLDHPLTGVGIGNFDSAMKRLPVCRVETFNQRCHFGHAHNDVAEWAAAQGIPGLLLLLFVYGLPLWLLLRLQRASGRTRFDGPAAAGILVIVGYLLCGVTQSMFAHQLTVSVYATVIGILTGLATREAQLRRGHRAAPDL